MLDDGTFPQTPQLPGHPVGLEARGIVSRWGEGTGDDHELTWLAESGEWESRFFASARFTEIVPIGGTDRVILRHEGGLLIVE